MPAIKKLINYKLLLHLYDAAFLKRWNDQVRTADFREIDKQAHKFITAFLIAKQANKPKFDWSQLIESGVFEFLHRLSLTDLKPPLFHRITADKPTYRKLIKYSKKELGQYFTDKTYLDAYEKYFLKKLSRPTLYSQILDAANYLASWEEFEIIREANPNGYGISTIDRELSQNIKDSFTVPGVRQVERNPKLRSFIKLCGQLRFQIRWSHMHRVPETSVLGHMLTVAVITYFFMRNSKPDAPLLYNNFFTALFHDLPEALTRDVISPLKRVGDMSSLVKKYEHEEMEKKVYPLLPKDIAADITFFTEHEFTTADDNGTVIRNGDLIKAVDELAAYLEAYLALQNGVHNDRLKEARINLFQRYSGEPISGVDFASYYKALEKAF